MHELSQSAWLKLERAGMHLDAFDEALAAWLIAPQTAVVSKSNEENGDEISAGAPAFPVPQIHPLIGDIVHNYRSALDHLAWALVKHNGATPGEKTAFPLSRSADHFRRWGRTSLPGMAADAKEAIKRLQPCFTPEPTHALWLGSLDYLSTVDRHRHFNMTVIASDHGTLTTAGLTFGEGPPRNESVQSILYGIREISTQILTEFEQHFFTDDQPDEASEE